MAKKVNKLCEDCKNYQMFGENCFFFWNKKKECSNHIRGDTGQPGFKKVEFCEE